MTLPILLFIVFLAAIETLASYISRVYAEFGKILTREIEENLDAWEELVEPQLGLTRQHAAISAAVLQQLALGLIPPQRRRDRAGNPRRRAGRGLLQSAPAHAAL